MHKINRTAILATWAAGASSVFAGLADYDVKIATDHAGSLPYLSVGTTTQSFDTTNSAPFDFGAVAGSATMEFIVQGDPVAGGPNGYLAVGANATQSLRYEQWNETGRLGFTKNGVADYVFAPPNLPTAGSPTVLTHVAYRWEQDTTTMELYINGALAGIQTGAATFEMPTGSGFLGNNGGGNAGMSGVMERVTVYDEAVDPATLLAHADAWGGDEGSLANYDTAIADDNAGALPYTAVSTSTLTFDTTNSEPFDFGAIAGSATIEFIVSGDPIAGGTNGWLAVGANGTWSLRYEQWNNTSQLGFTQAGLADYLFNAPDVDTSKLESPTELTHVTYRWDQTTSTMELFLDGVLVGAQVAAASFEMPTGMGLLGNNAAGTEGMLGVIERVTVYDGLVSDTDILAHASAWLKPVDLHLAVSSDGTNLTFTWDSRFGKVYDLLSDTVLTADPATWPVYGEHEEIAATPDENTLVIPLPAGEAQRFFVVIEKDAPPILKADFEVDAGGFTMVDHSVGGTGSDWVLGDPDSSGDGGSVTTGNGGSTNCWGTDIGSPGFYATGTDTSLISPVIDLTEAAGATLSFAQAIDILGGDVLVVNVIDDTTDTVLQAAVHTSSPDPDIGSSAWETIDSVAITGGAPVRIEWRFTGNNDGTFMGAYIDDVEVSVK